MDDGYILRSHRLRYGTSGTLTFERLDDYPAFCLSVVDHTDGTTERRSFYAPSLRVLMIFAREQRRALAERVSA